MDNSQFETSTSNALIEIQRAQRVLDQTQHKIKMFKKQKQSASKYTTNVEFKNNALPDLRQYISYLINEDVQGKQVTGSSMKNINRLQSTAQIKNKSMKSVNNENYQLQNYKKTSKTEVNKTKQNQQSMKGYSYGQQQFFDIKKHTQQQLEKSHLVRLERIQTMYREQFEMLDKKIEELLCNREKIKKDKILLLRNNQELQKEIDQQRARKNNYVIENNSNVIVNQLRAELLKLEKKIKKIQLENSKIIKKKQELQTNMRVCIRNSKDQLEEDIQATRIKSSKSKSAITSKCPYH